MTSLLLALLWAVFVVLVLVPVSTIIVRLLLVVMRRSGSTAPGGASGYLLIVLPTLAPVVWFVSETLHQSETFLVGTSDATAFCYDLAMASVFLIGGAFAAMTYLARQEQARPGEVCPAETRRIQSLCEGHPALARWADRVSIVRGSEHDSATRGLFRPRVEIEATFAARLREDALIAVLLHEAEHVRNFDPLRNLVGHVCLTINPLGRWLVPEWQRWRAGRELRCDWAALASNANPLSLAEAIVLAARPQKAPVAAPLTGAKEGLLKLRVQRLIEPVAQTPESLYLSFVAPLLLAVELILPHTLSAAPIQQIHNVAFHPLLTVLVG